MFCSNFVCRVSEECGASSCNDCKLIFDTSFPFLSMCALCEFDCNSLFSDDLQNEE